MTEGWRHKITVWFDQVSVSKKTPKRDLLCVPPLVGRFLQDEHGDAVGGGELLGPVPVHRVLRVAEVSARVGRVDISRVESRRSEAIQNGALFFLFCVLNKERPPSPCCPICFSQEEKEPRKELQEVLFFVSPK